MSPQQVAAAVLDSGRKFWATAEAAWRLKLAEARQLVVKDGFATLAAAGQPALPEELAVRLADRLTAYRDEEMFMFPGAHDAIDALKAHGVKLALVTNGAADTQRAKVERFELAHRFDHIQIEGEHGFGKPEERAYLHAMEALGVTAPDTWMIGDNLEWEIEVPQRLGIYAIWMDPMATACPPTPMSSPTGSSARWRNCCRSSGHSRPQRRIRFAFQNKNIENNPMHRYERCRCGMAAEASISHIGRSQRRLIAASDGLGSRSLQAR